jgi:hypothetical protein
MSEIINVFHTMSIFFRLFWMVRAKERREARRQVKAIP